MPFAIDRSAQAFLDALNGYLRKSRSGNLLCQQRQQLDDLLQHSQLSDFQAEQLEAEQRERAGKVALDWSAEYRHNLAWLYRQGRMSEPAFLDLYQTYVVSGRLSLLDSERLHATDFGAASPDWQQDGRTPLWQRVQSLGHLVSAPFAQLLR